MKVCSCTIDKVEMEGQTIVLEGVDTKSNKIYKFISSRLIWFPQNLLIKDSKQHVTLFYEYDKRKVNAITWPYNLEIKKKNFPKCYFMK